MKKSHKIITSVVLLCLLVVSLGTTCLAMSNGSSAEVNRLTFVPDYIQFIRGSRSQADLSTYLQFSDTYSHLSGGQSTTYVSGSGHTYYSSAIVGKYLIANDTAVQMSINRIGYTPYPGSYYTQNGSGYPLGKSYGDLGVNSPTEGSPFVFGSASFVYNDVVFKYDTSYQNWEDRNSSQYRIPLVIDYYVPVRYDLSKQKDYYVSRLDFSISHSVTYATSQGYVTRTFTRDGVVQSSRVILGSVQPFFKDETIDTLVVSVVYPTSVNYNILTDLQSVKIGNSNAGGRDGDIRVTVFQNETFDLNVAPGNILGVSNSGGIGAVVAFASFYLPESEYQTLKSSYIGIDQRTDFQDVDMLEWLGNGVQGFFDIELFGFISLGGLLAIVVSVAVCLLVLKVFAGG